MDPFPFGVYLTIGALIICLIIVAFLLKLIVNRIKKSTGFKWAHLLYLFICIWPVVEIIKLMKLRFPWIKNPFFYFWFIFLIYSAISFFVESAKQKERTNG